MPFRIRFATRCSRRAHILLVLLLLTAALPGLAQAASTKCNPNLANVPQLTIPDHPEWVTVYNYAWANWKRLILSNRKMYNQCWIDEGFGAGGATWQWDTLFGTLGARWGFNEFPAIETQENFYYAQSANGFIGQKLSEQGETWKANSVNPPFFAWVEWEYYLMTGDASRFTKVINGRTVLKHLKDYFYFFWNSTSYHKTSGAWVWSGIDSGRDCVSAGYWVDLPAQMATAAYYLAKIAEVVGDTMTENDMLDKHAQLTTFLHAHHWNSTQGFYQNLNADGSFVTNQDSPQGLWTLIGRVATTEQVTSMVTQLGDSNKFFRYHPVPSVSAASPYYYSGCKWYGPTWPPDVIMTVKGLAAQDQAQDAFDIALEDVRKTVATYRSNGGHLCENYQADRDGCYGGRDLTWGSAGYVVSLMDIVLGLQPDAPNDALTWTVNLVEPYTVTNLRFGDNLVTLRSARRADAAAGAQLTVTTNSPFTLTVKVAGLTCTRVLAGNTTFDCGTFR